MAVRGIILCLFAYMKCSRCFRMESIMSKSMVKEQKTTIIAGEREENAFLPVQTLVIMAVFVAMTFVVTTYINIRIPFIPANGGLVHLGNVPVFVAAAIFGKKEGAVTGALGLGLFDLLNGWVAWAPFTFVICGLIGFTYATIVKERTSIIFQILAVVVAVIIKVGGYYIAEGIIYGNWIAPAASIPGNIVQITVAGIIAIPITVAIRKAVNVRQ